ncbi:unnamed protein product [Trichogramma brassicae]|uniref:DUF7041 domain-containing protein n=1 Tax=Trichogramma brassicae TaxID=86971 RepID=A0A6H5IE94_9HYME|nr:unnamed protein product [Trichogramma brassicae]
MENLRQTFDREGRPFMTSEFPRFWRIDPKIWLEQVEAFFICAGIRSDSAKYLTFVANAHHTILLHVADLIENPPQSHKYMAIKEAHLRRLLQGHTREAERDIRGQHLRVQAALGAAHDPQELRLEQVHGERHQGPGAAQDAPHLPVRVREGRGPQDPRREARRRGQARDRREGLSRHARAVRQDQQRLSSHANQERHHGHAPEVLLHVANYVRRQGSFGSYAELKNQLRLVYGRSPQDQLNSIIELHKNHRQPSFVIAAMKRWDDGRHSEKDLANIFLKHVNDYTVNLNKLNDIEKLDQLAEIVDQVASHKGVFKQDQSSGKLYVLNQIRDLLRILSPNQLR